MFFYIIVGIDVGIWTGIAISDLKGNISKIMSLKHASPDDIVRIIEKEGTPILFCIDVSKIPQKVKTISRKFNAKVFAPEKDLSREEKEKLVKGYKFKTDHERDALAAIKYFFKQKGNWLEKIEKDCKKYFDLFVDEIKRKVIIEGKRSIEDTIKEVLFEHDKKLRELSIEILKLRGRVHYLEEKLKEKERPRIIKESSKEIEKLKEIIRKYRKYIRKKEFFFKNISELLANKDYIPCNARIFLERLDKVNEDVIIALKEISPKEVVYRKGNLKEAEKLLKAGINIRKEKLTPEDVIEILKGKPPSSSQD